MDVARWRSGEFSRALLAGAVLVAASALALGVGLAHTALAQALRSAAGAQGWLDNFLFSVPLLVAGGLIVAARPRAFGFQVGEALRRWRLVLLLVAGLAALTALILLVLGPTPYSDADWLFETVWVPLSEETMFRGVFYTLLWVVLGRLYAGRRRTTLTVLFSGIAFGVAHAGNFVYNPALFTALQMVFAAFAGILMGYSRARTGSIYPAFLMHAAFNTVAVLL